MARPKNQGGRRVGHPSKNPGGYVSDMTPVDWAILELLPEEGMKVGYQYVAKTIKGVFREISSKDPSLTVQQVHGRVNALHARGYAAKVTVLPISKGSGYQITPAGREALTKQKGQ